jgi:PST family polysaccharide transporter
VLLVVPGMLVCITNGATLIGILLGARWNAAAPIFSWLCVGGLTSGVYLTAYWLFVSQGRARELRTFSVWAAVINVASYLIGSFWGVIGIATASSLGFVFLTTPLMLFGASRSGPVRLADIARCALPFVVVGFAVYAALRFGLASLGLRGLAQIVAATLASYALFVLLSLTSRSNRQLMRGAVRSLKGLLPA